MLEYLTESAVWSLGGLVVGYILGRTEREVREILDRDKEHDDQSEDH